MGVSTESLEQELAARKAAILDHQRDVCRRYPSMTSNEVRQARNKADDLRKAADEMERAIQGWKRKASSGK